MAVFHDLIKKDLAQKLHHVFNQISLEEIYQQISLPPQKELGDYAFPCFILAKTLKKSPVEVSQELSQKIFTDEVVTEVISAGPFLNFKVSHVALKKYVLDPILSEDFFKRKLSQQTPKTMIEFSQPNTHKELHVGHMRNLCLGDALVRLHRYCGYEVIASTFPGDMGTHVAKCLWYLKNVNQSPTPLEHKGAWLGEMYSKAHNYLENQRGTPQEEKNREALTDILQQLEKKSGPYFDLWLETRHWSLELMHKVYAWAGVHFDKWYFESEVDEASLQLVKKYIDQGLFIKDEGAIGIDLSAEKLGFFLLLKTDGRGMYSTKDLELARRKFEDYHIEKNIYVVDVRQELHFKQVFKTLEKMGFEQAKHCYHLKYDFVELPDGAMSSRKGNIIPLESLVTQMEETIKKNYLARYQDQWSPQEINKTAHEVAQGAIKFGMTSIDSQRKIVFKMEDWLRLDGDTGPYLQYVHARICSLIQKSDKKVSDEFDAKILQDVLEKNLLLKLAHFNNVVVMACEQYKPHLLTTYLYELCQNYNSFYAECSIQKAETTELSQARLSLSWACALVLRQGLMLLGIPAPQRM